MRRVLDLIQLRAIEGACVVIAAHDPRITKRVAASNTLWLRDGQLVGDDHDFGCEHLG
jgi:ABC-type ATPase involved in cell division